MPKVLSQVCDTIMNTRGDLLTDQNKNPITGLSSGCWSDISARDKFSLHIIIPTGTTVQIRGSNEPNPADNTDGIDLVAAGLTNLAVNTVINATTMITFKHPMKWLKVMVTIFAGGGPLHAYLEGV